jgi:hypothetical protein
LLALERRRRADIDHGGNWSIGEIAHQIIVIIIAFIAPDEHVPESERIAWVNLLAGNGPCAMTG